MNRRGFLKGVGAVAAVAAVGTTMAPALGTMRVSPPLLARPFAVIEAADTWVYMACGVCGPCKIENIRVNDTALEAFTIGSAA